MKKFLLATSLVFAVGAANAAVINFDGDAPASSTNNYGTTGSYTSGDFSFRGTGGSTFQTMDPAYIEAFYPHQNNTDFAFISGGSKTAELFSATQFSLESFNAANLLFTAGDSLTVTGYNGANQVAAQNFSLAAGSPGDWGALFTLTGTQWTGLTKVTFLGASNNIGFDNITVSAGTPAVPVPAAVWLFATGLASFRLFKKRQHS